MLRRRRELRGRVLEACVEVFEHLDPSALSSAEGLREEAESILGRFSRIDNYIKRDMRRLLETEMVAPQLELLRHGANYFLDNLVAYLEDRAKENGAPMASGSPLDRIEAAVLEAQIRRALELSPASLGVFLKNIVSLGEFEREVEYQRKRLAFFLGCEKSLAKLAETNEDIIEASLEEFEKISERFFRICALLRDELPTLLEQDSPFPELARELATASTQLRLVIEGVLDPLDDTRVEVEQLDTSMRHLEKGIAQAQVLCQRAEKLEAFKSDPGLKDGKTPLRVADIAKLRNSLELLSGHLEALTGTATTFGLNPLRRCDRTDLGDATEACQGELQKMGERIIAIRESVLLPALDSLKSFEDLYDEEKVADLTDQLQGVATAVGRVHRSSLAPAQWAVRNLRQRNVLLLKEKICQEMGSIRTTFLQPGFAHIAASDPRSTQTPQYFFIKEFAEETVRSKQLLDCVKDLLLYIEGLQDTEISGLKFTPQNLNKIAKRVLLEKKSVPSGPGWRELAAFLTNVKNKLAPRLQLACALPGMRFDDRRQLSAFSDRLSASCSDLLTQRETAFKLVQEMERKESGSGAGESFDPVYRDLILEVTCGEMATSLRSLSRMLMELMPYVAALVAGIQMRTSLTFSRSGQR